MKHGESNLQKNCVKWFDLSYPLLKPLLFAVPNGHKRNKITAAILKAEGVRAGVADMFFAYPVKIPKQYSGLFIEFKFGKNKQTDSQIEFQKLVERQGYRYEVVCEFDHFRNLIDNYLGE